MERRVFRARKLRKSIKFQLSYNFHKFGRIKMGILLFYFLEYAARFFKYRLYAIQEQNKSLNFVTFIKNNYFDVHGFFHFSYNEEQHLKHFFT